VSRGVPGTQGAKDKPTEGGPREQSGYAYVEEALVGVLHPLRPLDEIKPRSTQQFDHVIAQDAAGVVAITAPDKLLDLVQSGGRCLDQRALFLPAARG
jgi:hypothetical protein